MNMQKKKKEEKNVSTIGKEVKPQEIEFKNWSRYC